MTAQDYMCYVTQDYTDLAATYSLRPRYAALAIDRIVNAAGVSRPRVADIGAGTGHLTLDLHARNCQVDAVEPNDAMRAIGVARTAGLPDVTWRPGSGEVTGLPSGQYDIVTFGSSFGWTDRPLALRESARLLRSGGVFSCIWNHRVLDDPLQSKVEALFARRIPGYGNAYGVREDDQAKVIEESGLFSSVATVDEVTTHRVPVEDWLTAWRSHANLQARAGERFDDILDELDAMVRAEGDTELAIPYRTAGWLAERG